jgi:hypothetical protein
MKTNDKPDNHNCPENRAVIRGGRVISGCDLCLGNNWQQDNSATYNRNWDKREHARDTIQPNQPDQFAKEYPKEARELGYTDEMMRKYG